MTDENISQRLTDLEIHISEQNRVIEDLNETITRQWAEIDRLKRLYAQLDDRFNRLEGEFETGGGGEDPPPPHY